MLHIRTRLTSQPRACTGLGVNIVAGGPPTTIVVASALLRFVNDVGTKDTPACAHPRTINTLPQDYRIKYLYPATQLKSFGT